MKPAVLQPQPLSNGTRMRDLHCLCLILSFLWEQMAKAYKYMSGVFLVSHSSDQQATDSSRPPSKMDVNRLQEQYHYLKEKQKLQTHVVVFKTGSWADKERQAKLTQPASMTKGGLGLTVSWALVQHFHLYAKLVLKSIISK